MPSGFGDLIAAWKGLGTEDAEARGRIASLLGFERRSSVSSPVISPQAKTVTDPGMKVPLPNPDEKPSEGMRRNILTTVIHRSTASDSEILGSENMEVASTKLLPLPPKEPLFRRSWQRSILSALLHVPFALPEPDTDALFDALSQGRRIDRLQWRTAPSLSLGVRCFLDAGPVMDPLLEDQRQLLTSLRLLFGQERVSVARFETLPDGEDVQFEKGTENAASPRAPVLVVSDFGLMKVPGRRWALQGEWVQYIRRERQRGAMGVYGLAPLSRARLPKMLQSEMLFLAWDRFTNVGTVMREGARRGSA